ncbi:MAG: ParA family protein, partial [Planctomycetota bacterium]
IKIHKRLADGISQIGNDKYDVVFIDCPPNFNIVTKNAIVASNHLLIPAKPDYLSTLGIDYLIFSLNKLINDYNEYSGFDELERQDNISPTILGIVFTMVTIYNNQPIQTMRPFIEQTKKLGKPVFDQYIRENKTMFGDAPQYGVPVALNYYSSGTYAYVAKEL